MSKSQKPTNNNNKKYSPNLDVISARNEAHLLKLKKQAAKHWWWSKNASTANQKERNKEALAAVREEGV